jgi:hypothetical protein
MTESNLAAPELARPPIGRALWVTTVETFWAAGIVSLILTGDYSDGWLGWEALAALFLLVPLLNALTTVIGVWKSRNDYPGAVQAYAANLASDTGVWRDELDRVVLTVRWDGAEGHYWIKGTFDREELTEEEPWVDSLTLGEMVQREERTNNLRPEDTEATRAIRGRLMIPGWSQFESEGSI